MLCRIALFKKIYSFETQKVVGRFFYGKDIAFGKFTDCGDYVFNHLLAVGRFRGEINCYLSIKRISYSVNSVKCKSFSAFDFGNSCPAHTDSVSDLSLCQAKFNSSLSEKLTDFIELVFHIIILCKYTECFLYMKQFDWEN